ncbi:hypothetical protein DW663_01295 [Fusobacterium mortiferum]|uniref:Uncharacterized protein n=1 Tax=Fusobacterium mortiferum TaxID=850 RepID=A0A414Q2N9_FUSMR|nr:hypothetical protein [Fusobacterium mortiferum]RHF75055.1 hypothetical protein DW663_01295 [Fusobacterium mortiferum]
MTKVFDSVIYVVCNPDGVPMKAYTSEQSARNHLVNEVMERGDRFSIELVNLDIDMDFAKRAKFILEGIALKEKKKK